MRPGLSITGFYIAFNGIGFQVTSSLNSEKVASYKNIRSRNVQMTFLGIIMPLNSHTYIKNVDKRAFVWSVLVLLIFRRIFLLVQRSLQMNRPSSGLQGHSDGRGGLIRHYWTSFESAATPTNRCMLRNFNSWAIIGNSHIFNSNWDKS